MRFRSDRRGMSLAAGVVAFIMVIVLLSILLLVFLPLNHVTLDETRSVIADESAERISVEMDMNVGDLQVQFQELDGATAQLHVVISAYVSFQDPNNFEDIEMVGVLMDDGTYSIKAHANVNSAILYNSDLNIRSYLLVDPGYPVAVEINVGTGSLNLTTSRNVTINDLGAQITTGSMKVTLMDGTGLNGSMDLRTTTGSIDLNWGDVRLGDGSGSVRTVATTGSVRVVCDQTSPVHQGMSWEMSTVTGSVDLDLSISMDLASAMSATTNVGSVYVSSYEGFNRISYDSRSAVFESSNYAVAMGIHFYVDVAGVGSINARLEQN